MSSHTMIQKILSATALIVAVSAPVYGQGTPMPVPRQTWLDNNGAPAADYRLCTFQAGTSTLADTFTTAALNVANANPLVIDSAGRGTVFLAPGSTYKFVLKDSTTTTCVPDTGSTIWSVDNVQAVPGSASTVDVTGTAGESISAGDAVFLSNGAGGLVTGRWYKTDSDLTIKSTYAAMVAVAPNAVSAGGAGSFRVSGTINTSGLSAGSAYFAGATAGALVVTPPTNAIRIGQAASATVFIVGAVETPVSPRSLPCGRLTLTTGVPVTTTDVTAATTLYYAPYGGCNTISTFDGVQWNETGFTQLSIAVPATTVTMYDVFAYDNSGVLALELTAWTNDTTRATALTTQNGVLVKTGALTRLYLGSFRTASVSGQTEDSVTKRFLYNYYHRVARPLLKTEATAAWVYNGALRSANGSTANRVELITGVAESPIALTLNSAANQTINTANVSVAIGQDSTSAAATEGVGGMTPIISGTTVAFAFTLNTTPSVGYHFYQWLEGSSATDTLWYGAAIVSGASANGISGVVWQ